MKQVNELKIGCALAFLVMFFSLTTPFSYAYPANRTGAQPAEDAVQPTQPATATVLSQLPKNFLTPFTKTQVTGTSKLAKPKANQELCLATKKDSPETIPSSGAQKPASASLTTKNDVQGCGDVWIDQLDASELNKLLNQTVRTIDGFGSKAAALDEKIKDNAGTGNADAVGAKHLFIPGTNGEPAILYDVMKKKVVRPDDACYLNNLITTGRVAFAARLPDNLRYCASGDIMCENGMLSADQISQFKDTLQALNRLRQAVDFDWTKAFNDLVTGQTFQDFYSFVTDAGRKDADVRDALAETGYTQEELNNVNNTDLRKAVYTHALNKAMEKISKKLEASPPTAMLEADQGTLDLAGADNIFLFPKTRSDFENFMADQAGKDRYTMLMYLASFAGGAAAAKQKPLRGIFSRYGTGTTEKLLAGTVSSGKTWDELVANLQKAGVAVRDFQGTPSQLVLEMEKLGKAMGDFAEQGPEAIEYAYNTMTTLTPKISRGLWRDTVEVYADAKAMLKQLPTRSTTGNLMDLPQQYRATTWKDETRLYWHVSREHLDPPAGPLPWLAANDKAWTRPGQIPDKYRDVIRIEFSSHDDEAAAIKEINKIALPGETVPATSTVPAHLQTQVTYETDVQALIQKYGGRAARTIDERGANVLNPEFSFRVENPTAPNVEDFIYEIEVELSPRDWSLEKKFEKFGLGREQWIDNTIDAARRERELRKWVAELNEAKVEIESNSPSKEHFDKFITKLGQTILPWTKGPALNGVYVLPLTKAGLDESADFIRGGIAAKMKNWWWTSAVFTAIARGNSAGHKAARVLSILMASAKFGRIFAVFSKVNFFTSGLVWMNNQIFRFPQYEITGATLEFSKDLKNYVDKQGAVHYIDVKKSFSDQKYGTYLQTALDRMLMTLGINEASIGSTDKDKDKTTVREKLRNIQDVVLIYDQNALAEGLNTRSSTVISSRAVSSKKYWDFFSVFPDSSAVYNFEHPSGYSPGGKATALAIHTENVNIGAVVEKADDKFTSGGMKFFIDMLRPTRNILAQLSMYSFFGAWARLAGPIALGAYVSTIVMPFGGTYTYNTLAQGYARPVDIKSMYENASAHLCSNKFNEGQKSTIYWLKNAILVSATISATTSYLPGNLIMIAGFANDVVGMYLTYQETELEEQIARELNNCVETSFEIVGFKRVPKAEDVNNLYNDLLAPIRAEAFKIAQALSPEVGQKIDELSSQVKSQVFNVNGDVDNSLASVLAKEVYHVYFKDANLKWFQGPTCNIDMCEQAGAGFKCLKFNGYYLLDEDGKPILDGVPNAASLRMNMKDGYASIVQKVIEVKKTAGPLIEITKDFSQPADTCFERAVAETKGVTAGSTIYGREVQNALGTLDAAYTPEAQMWFDGKDVAVQFFQEKDCGNDNKFNAREVFRFSGASIEFSKSGKVDIKNAMGTECSFDLGSGALSFSNGLVRSGFAQTRGQNTTDFTDVFHVFIYDLSVAQKDEFSAGPGAWSWEQCTAPDGQTGFRLDAAFKDGATAKSAQWNQLLGETCMVQWKGQNNETVGFKDNKICVQTPTGETVCYNILNYDSTARCFNAVNDKGEAFCFSVTRGPDGTPQLNTPFGPIPLLWATGAGGTLSYNPANGQISIKNEFPFAINPNFQNFGGGGVGMISPGYPPWGGPAAAASGGGGGGNFLAALPWSPSGNELAVFFALLALGLLFIRRKKPGTSQGAG